MTVFGLTEGNAAIMSARAGETAVGLMINNDNDKTTARIEKLFIDVNILSLLKQAANPLFLDCRLLICR
jgi:hypothetical protein